MGKDLTIEELVFDDKNFNKHTEQGMGLLEKSLQELGAGRSILVDKNNNIISGNGIAEAAGRVGIKKVRVIEVQGDELVAVRRTDMELDSEKGRKMALADNATAAVDLSWDYDTLQTVADEFDIDTEEWGVEFEPFETLPNDETKTTKTLPTLVFGKHKIPLNDDEAEWIGNLIDVYIGENGTYYGFISWLKDGMD